MYYIDNSNFKEIRIVTLSTQLNEVDFIIWHTFLEVVHGNTHLNQPFN